MTESQFIKENINDWKELENLLTNKQSDPDRLQVLFVKVSGDLSYARTNYPRRAVKPYLNSLLNKVFDSLRTRKKHKIFQKVVHFYKHTLPSEIIYNRKAFWISLFVFSLAVCIGIFSSIENTDFARQILGDQYVNMTEDNINDGDPMAVYKDADMSSMFLHITIKNIKVAFFTFVLGIMASVGSVFILIKNGVMLGAFQMFFYQKGLFLTSFLTIWIHGTIEISSIIIAGAAGIILGNGLLFPGTFSRSVALREAAVRSLTILLSTVPLFIVAGFLEGFVTRQTDLPTSVKAFIILTSLILILYIYLIRPFFYLKSGQYNKNLVYIDSENDQIIATSDSVIKRSIKTMRVQFAKLFSELFLPSMLMISFLMYLLILSNETALAFRESINFFDSAVFLSPFLFLMTVLFTAAFVTKMALTSTHQLSSWQATFKKFGQKPIIPLLFGIMLMLVLFFIPFWGILLCLFILPFPAFASGIKKMVREDQWTFNGFVEDVKFFYTNWSSFIVPSLVIAGIILVFHLTINSSVGFVLKEYLSWHELFEAAVLQNFYYTTILNIAMGMLVFILGYYYYNEQIVEINNEKHAVDLYHDYKSFGLNSTSE